MNEQFQDIALPLPKDDKLLVISDCSGTLVSPQGDVHFNKELFGLLIELKNLGHDVIIASDDVAGNSQTISIMLGRYNQDRTLFHLPDFDGPVVRKDQLPQILAKLGRDKADFIFDDDMPTYIPYKKHFYPSDTLNGNVAETRLQLAGIDPMARSRG